jgi:hypothetical protein
MNINTKSEHSIKAWLFRSMLGPAMTLDGIVTTITLGCVNPNASLWTARKLTTARIAATRKTAE